MRQCWIAFHLLFLIAFLATGRAKAQQPAFRHITLENGLPSNEVYHILPDSRGYLWFSTDRGVCRFDGTRFRNFSTRDGLPDNTVFLSYEDYQDRIWFLSFSPQLAYVRNDTFHAYRHNDRIAAEGMPKRVKLSMVVDSADNVSVGTIFDGWYRLDSMGNLERGPDTGWINVIEMDGQLLLSNLRRSNAPDMRLEFRKADGTGAWQYPIIQGSQDRRRNYFFAHAPGEYWIAFGGQLLYKPADGPVEGFSLDSSIDCVFQRRDHELWLGFFQGGARAYSLPFSEDKVVHRLLEGLTVTHIAEDREGGLWFSTTQEGVFYSPAVGAVLEYRDQLPSKRVLDICPGPEGVHYVSFMDGEIWRIQPGGEVIRQEGPPLIDLQHHCEIYFDPVRSQLWTVANTSSLVKASHDKEQILYDLLVRKAGRSHVPNIFPNEMIPSLDGGLWLGSRVGLMHLRADTLLHFIDNTRAESIIDDVYEDAQGTVWYSDINGLHRYAKGRVTHFGEEHPLGKTRIDEITGLPDGSLVMACRGLGLVWWRGDRFKLFGTEDGLSSMLVNDLAPTPHGSVWVATELGLDQVYFGAEEPLLIQHITASQGLPSSNVSKLILAGDELWVGTAKGLCKLITSRLPPERTPPLIRLEGMRVNGRDTTLRADYRLRTRQNYLTFSYSAISYRSGGQVSYEYTLEGMDQTWQRTTDTEARYNALPPGEYTFRVRAGNPDGSWSEPVGIRIEILPPFWQRSWFMALAAISVLSLGGFTLRRREKRNREAAARKLRTVELELTSLRAQMNPHFTFNTLNSIQHFITTEDSISANIHLARFARLIRKILENSRHNLISLQEETDTLELYLQLEKLRFKDKLEYEIAVDAACRPSTDMVPPMLIQPFVENAIAHGIRHKQGPGKVTIRLTRREDCLHCTVEDDGVGRDAARIAGAQSHGDAPSRGIGITRERLALMNQSVRKGWKMDITDLYDPDGRPAGTRVELVIPLSPATSSP